MKQVEHKLGSCGSVHVYIGATTASWDVEQE
jgi:hypothetical protein